MSWFRRKDRKTDPTGAGDEDRVVAELLDPYHHRASAVDGDRLVINASQVLDNIELALERLDLDINAAFSISEDVVDVDVLTAMVGSMAQGPTVALTVLNAGTRILDARYPRELARLPFPEQYDLRQLQPLQITDAQHELGRQLFNRRTASAKDLEWSDVPEIEELSTVDQVQLFVTLVFMFASKSGAIQWRMDNPNA
jgi:hypothetical protein